MSVLRATLAAGLLCWSTASFAAPSTERTAASAVETSEGALRQQVLPALQARIATADARVRGAEAWFAGAGTLDGAFPDLALAPLWERGFLDARRAQLDARAVARAAERVSPTPVASPKLVARLSAARTDALNAEERADTLELRFLAGLLSALSVAPELDRGATADLRAAWAAARAPTLAEDLTAPTTEQQAIAIAATRDELAWSRLEAAALRFATIPGDGALDALVQTQLTPEADPTAEPARLDRLGRVAPLLSAGLRAQVEAQVTAAAAEAEALQRAALEQAIAELDAAIAAGDCAQGTDWPARLAEAKARQAALVPTVEAPAAPTPPPADAAPPALSLTDLERRQAQRELEQAQVCVDKAAAGPIVGEDPGVATEKAAVARRAADEIRATEATDGKSQAIHRLRARIGGVHAQTAQVYEDEAARRAAAVSRLDAIETDLDTRVEAGLAAIDLPPLDSSRDAALDAAYLDLRASVTALYAALSDTRDRRAAAATGAEAVRDAVDADWEEPAAPSPAMRTIIDEYAAARVTLDEALETRDINLTAELDRANALLVPARVERRRLRAKASNAARQQARRDFLPELALETRAIPDQLRSAARRLVTELKNLPARVQDLTAIWAFFLGSTELMVVIVLWFVARQQALRLSDWALSSWEKNRKEKVDGDRDALLDAMSQAVFHGVDVVAAVILIRSFAPLHPVFGLAALTWLAVAIWRLAPAIVSLLLSTPDSLRPAVRLVTAGTMARARWTTRLVLAWYLSFRVLDYGAVRLLSADRIAELVGTLGSIIAFGISVVVVARWSPSIRATTAGVEQQNRLSAWIIQPHGPGLVGHALDLVKAAAGLVWLTVIGIGAAVTRLAESRAGLGWLRTAIAHRQIRKGDETAPPTARLPEALRAKLVVEPPGFVPRPAVEDKLRASYAAWQDERRRGLVSLVGDHGSGKSSVVARLDQIIGAPDMPTRWVPLDQHLTTPEATLSWLIERLSLDAEANAEAVEASLLALPPAVIAVDDAHRLFKRVVGGYAPLSTLIEVMHSTSHHHFWVMSLHAPTWVFLEGITAKVKLDAFRSQIRVGPMEAEELGGWLESRVTSLGYTLDFTALVTPNALGGDPTLATRKAHKAFFRVLAETSQGNPEVASVLWTESLSPGDGQVLNVHVYTAPAAADIYDLSDELLFALTALVEHDECTAVDLADVLNRRTGAALASCRHLVSIGVVAFSPATLNYRVATPWRPAVQRLLRQKHFLHGI